MARLAFFGTPAVAVPPLRALVEGGHQVVLVVSRPDRRRGRGGAVAPSPVKQAALELGLPVTSKLEDVLEVDVELGVVVAYGRLIPREVLDALPMLNVHFSLLPRWRGAAPVERAVLAGDACTGVSLIRLDEGLDTGPVIALYRTAIGEMESAPELAGRLSGMGASVLVEVLAGGVEALPEGEPQRGEPTYAQKVTPDELRLEWKRPAVELARVVRLGRAWTTFRGRRLRVLRAIAVETGEQGAVPSGSSGCGPGPRATSARFTVRAEARRGRESSEQALGMLDRDAVVTGAGMLKLLEVQPEARGAMSAAEWLRGVRQDFGERLRVL